MPIALFAGLPVSDFAAASSWYERMLGPATYIASDTEAVWELAEHRSLFIETRPERAGGAMHTVFLDDLAALEAFVASASGRGIEPAEWRSFGGGVREAVYRDPDGNEIAIGGAPDAGQS